jgi:hypothetical protein
MTTINRKKGRLWAVLAVALALGAGSATLSGTLAALQSRQAETAMA